MFKLSSILIVLLGLLLFSITEFNNPINKENVKNCLIVTTVLLSLLWLFYIYKGYFFNIAIVPLCLLIFSTAEFEKQTNEEHVKNSIITVIVYLFVSLILTLVVDYYTVNRHKRPTSGAFKDIEEMFNDDVYNILETEKDHKFKITSRE